MLLWARLVAEQFMHTHLCRSLFSASGCLCAMMPRDLHDLDNHFHGEGISHFCSKAFKHVLPRYS